MTSIYKSAKGREIVQQQYDALLAQLSGDIEHIYVDTAQGSSFVLAAGKPSSPTIVFLHGSLSNSITWANDLSYFSKQFRVFAVDIIGEAGKSAESRPTLHSDANAEWLKEVLDKLNASKAVVVGLSLGGWFALDFSNHFPERVSGLVLMSPGGISKNRDVVSWILPYFLLGPWGIKKAYQKILGPLGRELEDTELSRFLQLIPKHVNPRTEDLPIFTDAQLAAISCPVLLLLGAKDVMVYPEEVRSRLQENLQAYDEVYLENAGHYLGNQSAQIERFLQKVYIAESSV
ncbi:MAG: alpha/beta hydrolase [Trueperaceae bacterium]|nr:alpha/beta hydrolase [Trueperaceae bacterium]